MKIKLEYIILVILILALSLYLALRNQNKTNYEMPKLPDLHVSDISKLEISRAGSSLILNKKDNKWYMEPSGHMAELRSVSDMLESLKKFTLSEFVSGSKNYERYDLGDDKKISVKAWAGDSLKISLALGRPAASFRHTFATLAEDSRVFLAQDNLRPRFDVTEDKLRDKTILSFKEEQIHAIDISEDEKLFSLRYTEAKKNVPASSAVDSKQAPKAPSKAEMVWIASDGGLGDEAEIHKWLTVLSELQCLKFIDDKKKTDFVNPIYVLRLKGAAEYTISVFGKSDAYDGNYPVTSSSVDSPFMFSAGQAKNVMRKLSDLTKRSDVGSKVVE